MNWRKHLYPLNGKGVPLAYIRRVYESNFKPPITPEYVERLIVNVRNEMIANGTLQSETRPNVAALEAYRVGTESDLSRKPKRSKKRGRKKNRRTRLVVNPKS